MRRWGFAVTGFYGILLVTLFWPVTLRLGGRSWVGSFQDTFNRSNVLSWDWAIVGVLVVGQALLLFLPVDTSWRRARPRQHVWVSAAVAGWLMALLAFASIASVFAAISEDTLFESLVSPFGENGFALPLWVAGLWTIWGGVFYSYYRGHSARLTRTLRWLLAGSVLELLVAVPAHVIVRHRDDCSAPMVTGFGITTGLAVMLACFGPGVLALYRKRLARYRVAPGKSVQHA